MADTEKRIRIAVAVLALAGLAIMSYLTYIHYANKSSFCDISENVSCDVVTTSVYSEIFGVPMSLLGLGYFVVAFILAIRMQGVKGMRALFLMTLFVLMPSLYLSFMEFFVIKALCILCEGSKALMITILIISGRTMNARERISGRMVAPVVIAGVVAALVTYFAQEAGTSARADYSDLVRCMNEAGVTYYKSVKCGNCKRQEKMLGAAYKNLNSIECHPEGPNPQVQLCVDKEVTKTPTFIREAEGIELGRLEGLQPLQRLADFSGCPDLGK